MSDDEVNVMDYFRLTRKNWFWALVTFILVFFLVLTYFHFSEPVYEAKSLISISNQNQASFLLGSSAPKLADIETQKLIIQSPQILQPIEKKFGKDYFKLSVNSVRNANVIEIVVHANEPANAVLIASEITNGYINYTMQSQIQSAQATIAYITERIEIYDQEIDALNSDIEKFDNRLARDVALTQQEKHTYELAKKELAAKTSIYDFLLTKREEATLASSMNTANVGIIFYPEVAVDPIRPNKQLSLALAVVLGLGAAFVIANMINNAQRRRRRPHLKR